MEHTKIEVTQIEFVEAEATEAGVRELTELQLVLVGGGSGDVTLV